MAEPESAVLPITPYPIGCLKPLVRANSTEQNKHLRTFWKRRYQPLSADVQTTKDSPSNPQAWSCGHRGAQPRSAPSGGLVTTPACGLRDW